MAHFQKITKGSPPKGKKNAVVMGRKTWEEIKRPLKDRYNIVMSRSLSEKLKGMVSVKVGYGGVKFPN